MTMPTANQEIEFYSKVAQRLRSAYPDIEVEDVKKAIQNTVMELGENDIRTWLYVWRRSCLYRHI